jgi:F-type H+-transporting ATPase subunit b
MSGFTLIFQIINFLVLMALLHRFLFKPVLAMVAKRQEAIERAASEGERVRHDAGGLQAAAQKALADATEIKARALGDARAQAERERISTLEEARREAEATLAAAKSDIADERDRAAEAMTKSAVDIGVTLAQRLLGQIATQPILETFLSRLCESLEGLSDERKRALLDDLGGADLVVATAPPLDAEAARRWLSAIEQRLGRGPRLRAVGDESLLAGAELRFPHAAISFCWRDGIQAARAELTRP